MFVVILDAEVVNKCVKTDERLRVCLVIFKNTRHFIQNNHRSVAQKSTRCRHIFQG